MRRVLVVCEGQTEEAFIGRVMYPAFAALGLHLQGITIETSPGHKGGGLRYERVRRNIRNSLASRHVRAVTTLIDLYQLASDFPGHGAASAQPHLAARLGVLESHLHADIVAHCGCDPERFIAHIQPHEFEALLFSDVATLAGVESSWSGALPGLQAARAQAESPEHINHGQQTKPSSRLMSLLHGPSYRKLRHGPIAAERIGLPTIEAECPHFAGWLGKIRTL